METYINTNKLLIILNMNQIKEEIFKRVSITFEEIKSSCVTVGDVILLEKKLLEFK